MECQREPSDGPVRREAATPPPVVRRVQLTDQALVAVTIARQVAHSHGRRPTAGDLLVGLATEPEGWAGHLLRAGGEGPVISLVSRAGSQPPALASLDESIVAAATRTSPRPPGTADLLVVALEAGGEDLGDLLAACALPDIDLRSVERRLRTTSWYLAAEEGWGPTAETVTLTGPDEPAMEPAAARAVGRVRAIAGGAVDLLSALDLDVSVDLSDWLGTNRSELVLARLQLEREEPAAGTAGWDLGLGAVLDAARILAADEAISVGVLLQGTLVAGGAGPLAVVEAARTARAQDEERPEAP
jgi:hypothetical protein